MGTIAVVTLPNGNELIETLDGYKSYLGNLLLDYKDDPYCLYHVLERNDPQFPIEFVDYWYKIEDGKVYIKYHGNDSWHKLKRIKTKFVRRCPICGEERYYMFFNGDIYTYIGCEHHVSSNVKKDESIFIYSDDEPRLQVVKAISDSDYFYATCPYCKTENKVARDYEWEFELIKTCEHFNSVEYYGEYIKHDSGYFFGSYIKNVWITFKEVEKEEEK